MKKKLFTNRRNPGRKNISIDSLTYLKTLCFILPQQLPPLEYSQLTHNESLNQLQLEVIFFQAYSIDIFH